MTKRGALIVVVALALSGCAGGQPAARHSPSAGMTHALDKAWRELPSGFPVRDAWMGGPLQLLGAGDCYVAVGQDDSGTGLRPQSWTAGGDCTAPRAAEPKPQPMGDGLPSKNRTALLSIAAINGDEYVAIGRTTYHGDLYAYETFALRGVPGAWKEVARFESTDDSRADHVGPIAVIARPGGGFIAPGRRGDAAVVWTSADAVAWQESSRLAVPEGYRSPHAAAAVSDGKATVVIVGNVASGPRVFDSAAMAWVSEDGGRAWRPAVLPSSVAGEWLHAVVHDGRRFVAVGEVYREGVRQAPLVMASEDGRVWQREPALAPAAAAFGYKAAVAVDGVVFASAWAGGYAKQPVQADRACASVWRLTIAEAGFSAREEKLGCHGIPVSMAALRDGRIAAVHWNVLWLRTPSA